MKVIKITKGKYWKIFFEYEDIRYNFYCLFISKQLPFNYIIGNL